MSKNKGKKEKHFLENDQGVSAVQNQLFDSYQKGVVEDQLKNNKNIYTFNNQKK